MKYDAIMFDYDGTVADSLGDIRNAVNHALRQFGLPERSAQELKHLLGSGARYLIRNAVPEDLDDETEQTLYEAYIAYYAAHASDTTEPYPGMLDAMRALQEKGVLMAVVSNKPDAAVQPGARKLFPGLLSLTVGERTGVRRKPWPDMLIAAAEQLQVRLERCVYVGDTEVDLETARNTGIDCIAVSWGFRTREELAAAGAKIIIDRPEEFLRVIEE